MANVAPIVANALNYKLDRNATRAAHIFRRSFPDIDWSIPSAPPSHQVGLPIELRINSQFGVAGFRPSGVDYGGTNTVRRVTLSMGSIAAQVFVILNDTVTVFLYPPDVGSNQIRCMAGATGGRNPELRKEKLKGFKLLHLRPGSHASSLL